MATFSLNYLKHIFGITLLQFLVYYQPTYMQIPLYISRKNICQLSFSIDFNSVLLKNNVLLLLLACANRFAWGGNYAAICADVTKVLTVERETSPAFRTQRFDCYEYITIRVLVVHCIWSELSV